MNIKEIFDKQYIVSAAYECSTKIANIADGLKSSARKILYTCLDENIKSKKLGQLTARTSDKTNYIHGEASLTGVAVGMAQRFVGTNNIPLLQTDGSFGSRLLPEPAAPRYVFTGYESYLKNIFKDEDNNILETQIFEGDKIEPKYYLPVIPMLLVNGSDGIAIGFAQYILPRKPSNIIKYILNKINNKKVIKKQLLPYWNGFKGDVKEIQDGVYEIYGKIDYQKGKGIITELPINVGYKKYIDILDTLIEKDIIVSYKDKCDTYKDEILIEIKFNNDYYQKIINNEVDLYADLKLKTIETETYICIGIDGLIHQYNNIYEIIDEYIDIRLDGYKKRKSYMIKKLNNTLALLCSKYLFINGVLNHKIKIHNQTEDDIIKQILINKNIIKYNESYDYLLKIPIASFTKENVEKLKSEIVNIKNEIKILEHKSIINLWEEDISLLNFN